MKRSKPMRRGGALKRRTRVKPVNPSRKAANTARAYGDEARVRWIQDQPCLGCGRTPSVNAHTANEGKSRKGHHSTIVPLCPDTVGRVGCHTKYDQHKAPFDTEEARDAVKAQAAFLAARWEYMGTFTSRETSNAEASREGRGCDGVTPSHGDDEGGLGARGTPSAQVRGRTRSGANLPAGRQRHRSLTPVSAIVPGVHATTLERSATDA